MQEFKQIIVKSLDTYIVRTYLAKVLFLLLCIPPLSIGLLSYKPYKIYKCVRVLDGDTVILERNKREIKVRLSYIDAPESNQLSFDKKPIGVQSTNFLKKRLLNKYVSFSLKGIDQYGRRLGEIFLNKQSINLEMVSSGHAVPYHLNSIYIYRQAHYRAKIKRLGIWNSGGFIAPTSYRRKTKKPEVY